jgi:hypothetical protein
MPDRKIMFVYNANAGFVSQIFDYAHKIVSPKTYPCSLCQLTYGNFGMEKKWKEFVTNLPFQPVFYHKEEFKNLYPQYQNHKLPSVFIEDGLALKEIVTAEEMNKQEKLDSLITLVSRKIKDTDPK